VEVLVDKRLIPLRLHVQVSLQVDVVECPRHAGAFAVLYTGTPYFASVRLLAI
jgi:hypothetical protein